jgi:ketosteroid isomerase-like protein
MIGRVAATWLLDLTAMTQLVTKAVGGFELERTHEYATGDGGPTNRRRRIWYHWGKDCGGWRVASHLRMGVASIVARAHLLSLTNRDRDL